MYVLGSACQFLQADPKIFWKCEELRIPKTILKEKKKVGGLKLSDFKTYSKAIVIKDRHINQRNRTESPEVNPYIYDQ